MKPKQVSTPLPRWKKIYQSLWAELYWMSSKTYLVFTKQFS